MMNVEYSKQFRKDVIRLNPKIIQQFKERLILFQKNPHHPFLDNHPLKGILKPYWSFNVTGDIRVQYYIEKAEGNVILKLVRIGSHSELYG